MTALLDSIAALVNQALGRELRKERSSPTGPGMSRTKGLRSPVRRHEFGFLRLSRRFCREIRRSSLAIGRLLLSPCATPYLLLLLVQKRLQRGHNIDFCPFPVVLNAMT